MPPFCPAVYREGVRPSSSVRCTEAPALTPRQPRVPAESTPAMDIAIQHPWFKRALGPFYPSRLFDQFFGEGLFEYDLLPFLSSTISPYYRQSLFRTVLDSGISEVRPAARCALLRRQGGPGGKRGSVRAGPGAGAAPLLCALPSCFVERLVTAAGPLSRLSPPRPSWTHRGQADSPPAEPPVPPGGWEREPACCLFLLSSAQDPYVVGGFPPRAGRPLSSPGHGRWWTELCAAWGCPCPPAARSGRRPPV